VTPDLELLAETAVAAVGPDAVRRTAFAVDRGDLDHVDGEAALAPLVNAVRRGVVAGPIMAAYLRGLSAGYAHRAARIQAEVVWTGPSAFDVPVRSTEPVLLEVIAGATRELAVATYSAKPLPALRSALAEAVRRGVDVWVVVETLAGAGSAIQGDEPAKAFAEVPAVPLWGWDVSKRPEGAKMHAKLAVADESVLLVTSANLTGSGLDHNIEAGILVRGGNAPRRAAEHLRALRRDGSLVRI
jgi:phosphatidylserine/phosphatidylglycerophosphate/cardiolipin synthase-like enzyme